MKGNHISSQLFIMKMALSFTFECSFSCMMRKDGIIELSWFTHFLFIYLFI